MKKGWFFLGFLLLTTGVWAQEQKKQAPQYAPYYYQRASLFEVLPATSDDILFVGNSITDAGEWHELFENPHVKNRGISGNIVEGVYDRLPTLLAGKPAQIFLLIGVNDIARGTSADSIATGIHKIIRKIKQDSPQTELFVQSILPVTPHYNMFEGHTSRWEMVGEINRLLQQITREEEVTYIDLYSRFALPCGKMDPQYSNDGLHLLGNGYLLWKEIVSPYLKH